MTPAWRAGLIGTALSLILVACSNGSTSDATPAPTALPVAPTTTSEPGSATSNPPDGSGVPTTVAASAPGATTAPAPVLAGVKVKLTPVAALEQPVAMALRPGDPTLYVAEQDGVVRAIRDGQLDPDPVLDMSARTAAKGEQGLLGLAFAPSGDFVYVSYTDLDGDSHLDEYVVTADGRVDPATRREVMTQDQPYPNHNGGSIVFGPDGHLYYGLGDGGSAGDPERRALRLDTRLGKLLRFDPRPDGDQPYTVPADNPFVGQAGALPEIWSYGLRNPWRFSFDAATGDLWIGDVGQNRIEEVDVGPAAAGSGRGLNFGWSAFEGTSRFNRDQPADGTVGPVYEYAHDSSPGGCSITGGYVYRGSAIPALQGAYLFADYCVGGVRALPGPAAGVTATELTSEPGSIASFGEGPDRELYVLSVGTGVLRVDPA